MPTGFDKRVILITGCSSGFGLSTVTRLASKGHIVIATMRDLKKQSALISELNQYSAKADIQQLDVTDKASIKLTMDYIAEKYGYLDILINNAGYGIGGAFEDLSDEDIRNQMETNFFGVLNVTRLAIPLMRHRKGAKIINLSSIAGLSASPCFGAYNCSKFALEAFSESLYYELKLFDINVVLIEPGMYKTKIFYENRRYAKNFDNPQSPYYKLSQKLKERVDKNLKDCFKNPNEIAVLIENIINNPNPSFRNFPDWESKIQYYLRKILPFGVYSWIIEQASLKKVK